MDTLDPTISGLTSRMAYKVSLITAIQITQLIRSEKYELYFGPKSDIVVNFENLFILTFSKIS